MIIPGKYSKSLEILPPSNLETSYMEMVFNCCCCFNKDVNIVN